MELQEFVTKTVNALQKYYGPEVRVETHQVYRNNGRRLYSVCALKQGRNVAPTIYLNEFYEKYLENGSFSGSINAMIRVMEENQLAKNLNVDFFADYEEVKKKLVYRLIHRERNKELLADVPYREFQDLAIVCQCLLLNEEFGTGSIVIHRHHLQTWGITEDELFADAAANSPVLEPFSILNMSEVIREMMTGVVEEQVDEICSQYPEDREKLVERTLDEMVMDIENSPQRMYVLTNANRYYGAACMVYSGVLEYIGGMMKCDYYILPSSVHEVIFVSKSGETEEERLNEMVREVNESQVEPEEWLSDHAYLYRWENKEIVSLG
jgi:hypothetical protein